jgi:tetratricopeptide (TPR) repeat protein
MPDADLKYRAFLSYSHADTGTALRVHSRLEGFHIDKELVGRVTAAGPIPKSLRPIFRDRNDFDPGASLGAETVAALDDSAALVLLASTHAARSKYVNGEVRLFKSRHPDRPVIPVIVDGTPGDPDGECFPPALRFVVAPDGTITGTPADVLAADLREKGDGFALALAKVVARLIGLAPDDVYRRAERERRRQTRLRMAIVAVIALLAIVGGGLFWQSQRQKATLNEIAALVDKYSLAAPGQAAVPGARQNLTQAITAIAEGAATDPRYAQALALLKAGKPDEAEPLLKAVAEDKEKSVKDAAAAYRDLASIAGISNPARARDYYARAAGLDPSDVNGMLLNGLFQEQAGQLDDARAAFARVITAARPGADDGELVLAKYGMADIAQQRGDLGAALATYYEAQAIADRLAQSDPGNAFWQAELGLGNEKIGDLQVAKGDLAAALKSYEAKREIISRLAQSEPGNAFWQYDLSVSYNKIGDVQMAQGNLPAALISYQASFAIRDRLAKSDPGNAGWQHELSVSYKELGDAQVAQGNLPAALTSYQEGLAIAEHLAQADLGNAGWQRDLSVSHNEVGDVQVAQGNLPTALASYQASLAIMERLVQSDPGNVGWRRDLSVSHNKNGDVQVAQGNLPAALTSYQAALAIAEHLTKSDPSIAGWQRDLSVSYDRVGNVQMAQGNLPAALTSYQASFAIRDRIAKSDPGNAGWQRDLSVSHNEVGDVQMVQGNLPAALASYQAGLAIAERLAQSDPGNAGWQRDLSVAYNKVGGVQMVQGNLSAALTCYQATLAIAERLAQSDPGNAAWQRDLQIAVDEIGSLAFNLVLAGDFTTALEAIDRAISVTPDQVWLYSNRAHALMFLERRDEARVLYLKYRGQTLAEQSGNSWEAVILVDFAQLRQAGLTNPLMGEIEKLFASAG